MILSKRRMPMEGAKRLDVVERPACPGVERMLLRAQQEDKKPITRPARLFAASTRLSCMWMAWRRKSSAEGRAFPFCAIPGSKTDEGKELHALPADREMAVEALAQFRLEQLACRGMRERVDEHDVVGNLPFRQLAGEEMEDGLFRRLPAVAGVHDQKRPLLPTPDGRRR
jgi:hypothetical protein